MGSKGAPELPAAASPLAEGSPPPSFQSDRVKALKQVEPVDIQWERVTLRVPAKGGAKKTVLADVSGQLRAACITAIMVGVWVWADRIRSGQGAAGRPPNRIPSTTQTRNRVRPAAARRACSTA